MRLLIAALAATLQLLVLLAWSPGAMAAILPQAGQSVTGWLELLGKRVALPPGEWRIAATGFSHVVGGDPGPYGAIGDVLLVRPQEDALHSFVVVRTNALPVTRGWGPPRECVGPGALFHSSAEPRDLHDACSFVAVERAGRMRSMIGSESLSPGSLPPWALIAGFRVSDRNDVLELRYGIAPDKPDPAGWFRGGTLNGPHRDIVARLGEWAQQARQASAAALRDPAAQVPSIPALSLGAKEGAPTKDENLLTATLNLYKPVIYRLPSTAFSMAVASYLAGNLYTGAVVAAWQSATHAALFLGNELAWDWPTNPAVMRFMPTPNATPQTGAATPIAIAQTAFAIDGKQVPLPKGRWTVLAEDTDIIDDAVMTGLVLARIEDKKLLGLAIARTNRDKTADIFGTTMECARGDFYFSVIRYDTPVDGYCTYGKAILPDDGKSWTPLWTKARGRLAELGVLMPDALMVVGARARTSDNMLDVRYYFPPDRVMTEADLTGAKLSTTKVTTTPLLFERVVALQGWADLMQIPLEQSVHGRLQQTQAELPWPWQTEAVQAALVLQARAPLEALRAVGAIDEAELQRQIALADAALADRERQRWSLWLRSTYKLMSYGVLSYFDAVAVSWIVTGSYDQAVTYAIVTAVAQPALDFISGLGGRPPGAARTPAALKPVEFPDIGLDRF